MLSTLLKQFSYTLIKVERTKMDHRKNYEAMLEILITMSQHLMMFLKKHPDANDSPNIIDAVKEITKLSTLVHESMEHTPFIEEPFDIPVVSVDKSRMN